MARRVSQRSLDVSKAKARLGSMIIEHSIEHDLTSIELLQALVETQQSVLKYMLRSERHPDNPDYPADMDEEATSADND